MVTDEDRIAATKLRDSLGFKVSDKELFSAIFDVVNVEKVKELLSERRAVKVQNSEREKIKQLEAKLKEKLQKLEKVQTEEAAA
jgi:hypothetical protein